MKRRDFLKHSVAAAGLAGASTMISSAAAADSPSPSGREYYELRTYTLKSGTQARLDPYLEKAYLPALNRLGVKPVGVFTETTDDALLVYVLAPYASLDQLAAVSAKLPEDVEYQKAGADYLSVPASDPVYVRMESSVLRAFTGFPKMTVPANQNRIFQLRTYESHSEKAGQKKIEMFNTAEIGIFQRVGLHPVFFGETILGAKMPNLTYMLTFEDKAMLDKNWAVFRADPEWLKLKAIPEYADKNIVSHITNRVIAPTAYSQI